MAFSSYPNFETVTFAHRKRKYVHSLEGICAEHTSLHEVSSLPVMWVHVERLPENIISPS
jgi:hypothetical protein